MKSGLSDIGMTSVIDVLCVGGGGGGTP